MERYFGSSGSRIVWVGNKGCGLKVPDHLLSVSDRDLMEHYRATKDGELVPRTLNKQSHELKIAFVGVWKIPCGISTYTEYLLNEMTKLIGSYKIFAEYSDGSAEEDHVLRCWRRGESLIGLADAINEYDPDVVLVQHEYGMFPDAKRWLSFLTAIRHAKVYVALHSVYLHKDKSICEAVIPNIIVHTDLARDVLVNTKKVSAPVHVVPHGCLLPSEQSKLWNLYWTEHTFMQFGFGFEYKGWENSLLTCAELKKKYPDVFFTGLMSESKYNKEFHDRYYERLQGMVDDLGIRDNVALIRGYQSEEILDSFFRTNKCLLLPYKHNGDHQVFAVTGAARLAMRSGIPVITSDVPFFSDLVDVCPQANTPEKMATAIESAWQDSSAQVLRQNEFLVKNSWENVSKLYLDAILK